LRQPLFRHNPTAPTARVYAASGQPLGRKQISSTHPIWLWDGVLSPTEAQQIATHIRALDEDTWTACDGDFDTHMWARLPVADDTTKAMLDRVRQILPIRENVTHVTVRRAMPGSAALPQHQDAWRPEERKFHRRAGPDHICLIYLTDATDGGRTLFPNLIDQPQGLRVEPRAGRMLDWQVERETMADGTEAVAHWSEHATDAYTPQTRRRTASSSSFRST
jgi:hypothetical protein